MIQFSFIFFTTSSLLEQKKPGQPLAKETGCSLELQLCVEASSSPDWPLDAPCAQGKPASTSHFPASPPIPKNQQGGCLLFYRCICSATAVRYPACFSCFFCCDFKLCTSCSSDTLHSSSGFYSQERMNSVWSPLSRSYQPLT